MYLCLKVVVLVIVVVVLVVVAVVLFVMVFVVVAEFVLVVIHIESPLNHKKFDLTFNFYTFNMEMCFGPPWRAFSTW